MSQPVKAIHNMLVQHDMHERRAHHVCILRLPNECRFMYNNLMIFLVVMCLSWRLYVKLSSESSLNFIMEWGYNGSCRGLCS